jgi:hypothetical protein
MGASKPIYAGYLLNFDLPFGQGRRQTADGRREEKF